MIIKNNLGFCGTDCPVCMAHVLNNWIIKERIPHKYEEHNYINSVD